jgi:hypothetical protein
MVRIVASQANLHWNAGFHFEFGRGEAEAFDGNLDHLRILPASVSCGGADRSSDQASQREQ